MIWADIAKFKTGYSGLAGISINVFANSSSSLVSPLSSLPKIMETSLSLSTWLQISFAASLALIVGHWIDLFLEEVA